MSKTSFLQKTIFRSLAYSLHFLLIFLRLKCCPRWTYTNVRKGQQYLIAGNRYTCMLHNQEQGYLINNIFGYVSLYVLSKNTNYFPDQRLLNPIVDSPYINTYKLRLRTGLITRNPTKRIFSDKIAKVGPQNMILFTLSVRLRLTYI